MMQKRYETEVTKLSQITLPFFAVAHGYCGPNCIWFQHPRISQSKAFNVTHWKAINESCGDFQRTMVDCLTGLTSLGSVLTTCLCTRVTSIALQQYSPYCWPLQASVHCIYTAISTAHVSGFLSEFMTLLSYHSNLVMYDWGMMGSGGSCHTTTSGLGA